MEFFFCHENAIVAMIFHRYIDDVCGKTQMKSFCCQENAICHDVVSLYRRIFMEKHK
jgi:hypothetical protein